MGNEVSSSSSQNDAVRVILTDGTVRELEGPVTAAELMMDHPEQVVVEYRHGGAGSPAPLPADEELGVKKVYLMLPMMRRGNKLTAEELRRVLTCADSVLRARSLLSFTGIIPVIVEAVARGGRRFEAVEMGRPENLRRQVSGKAWRPSLDTIKERKIERKLSHWLF